MLVAHQILVLLHLIGFAALLGGFLVQLRSVAPEINLTMLYGGWAQLLTGVTLVVLDRIGPERLDIAQLVVKGAITLFVVVLLVRNRRYASVPRGVLFLIGVLTLVTAGISVLWR